jgi:hypothetical protein
MMSSSLECPGLGQVKTRPVEPTIYSRQNFAGVLRARDRGARANFTILVQCLDPSCYHRHSCRGKCFQKLDGAIPI